MANRNRLTSPLAGKASGFTLLELMLVIGLSGLLLVIAFGGIRLATRAWSTVEDSSTAVDDYQITYRFLRDQLAQTQSSFPAVTGSQEPDVSFTGSPERFEFTAPVPGHMSNPGTAYRFTVTLDRSDTSAMLRVDYKPELGSVTSATNSSGQTRILLDKLDGGGFSYYGRQETDDVPAWRDYWESEFFLPRLVKIELYRREETQFWPAFILPVLTDTRTIARKP